MVAATHIVEFQTIGLRKHDVIGSNALNRLLSKDNIALGVLLKPTADSPLRFHQEDALNQVLVVNTHIHWDPIFCDVKLMQVQLLLEQLHEVALKTMEGLVSPSRAVSSMPTVIAGDFNSMLDSGVYELLANGFVEPHHTDLKSEDYGPYDSDGMKHPFNLDSAYKTVLGTEPPFTNYTGDFVGVLDYVWESSDTLVAARALNPISEEIVKSHNGALPNPYMCSDHIPLVVDIQPRSMT